MNEEELSQYKFRLEEAQNYVNPIKAIEADLNKLNPKLFLVPENLYAKDPLIFDTKEANRKHDNKYWQHNPYSSKTDKILNIRVSTELLNRALRIFQAIIKVIRYRGNDIITRWRN